MSPLRTARKAGGRSDKANGHWPLPKMRQSICPGIVPLFGRKKPGWPCPRRGTTLS